MASLSSSQVDTVKLLGEQLSKEVLASANTIATTSSKESSPSVEICQDIITALSKQRMTLSILQATRIGVIVGRANRVFKRQQRLISDCGDTTRQSSNENSWESISRQSTDLIQKWKVLVSSTSPTSNNDGAKREKGKATLKNICSKSDSASSPAFPESVEEYRSRLVKHGKELYKDPPVLPPLLPSTSSAVDPINYGVPKRDKRTGMLTFPVGSDLSLKQVLIEEFHPNRTPEEILSAGAFGGTYFRAIHSGVTNQYYNPKEVLADTVHPTWIQGLDASTMLTSQTYREHINKYGVKCGGSLGMWESSGWISDIDPYGWFQWYCRFYQGRRSADDARQISRWAKSAGAKGRFRSQLCNKILASTGGMLPSTVKGMEKITSVSPVIRQTLLHWGLEITPDVLESHAKRVGKK